MDWDKSFPLGQVNPFGPPESQGSSSNTQEIARNQAANSLDVAIRAAVRRNAWFLSQLKSTARECVSTGTLMFRTVLRAFVLNGVWCMSTSGCLLLLFFVVPSPPLALSRWLSVSLDVYVRIFLWYAYHVCLYKYVHLRLQVCMYICMHICRHARMCWLNMS